MELLIEEWHESDERWSDLRRVIDALDQARWVDSNFDWHQSSHMFVALDEGEIVGFLRFVTQIIGLEEDHQPVTLSGAELIEAKVLAFGVPPERRNRGIGRRLQEHALQCASQLGCYQIRSHSSGANTENHALKLAMGFAVHPVVRGDDLGGVYFVMPLRTAGR